VPTNKFGEALRAQVEERLNFFEVRKRPFDSLRADGFSQTGAPVSKNSDAIQKALTAIAADLGDDEDDDDDEEGDVDAVEISEVSPSTVLMRPADTPLPGCRSSRKRSGVHQVSSS
jgi:nucleolar protein 56